ncbi:1-deoxy-D-xylulose-5-phosphate synthase [Granulosicoccaceae sp. 1_MG-2023]|nr:1-deoxy-D-xylulose-5-phosphate synthase [Granulosicoccaceae sp. 1_MG-2023]
MTEDRSYPLLKQIDSPDDLRQLDAAELPALCDQLRDYLVRTVARIGGHLGASLGTVELTVALHYIFNTPEDRLVWDVGHQAYPHKILTGRREQLSSIRQKGGLAGFPKRAESIYDDFGVGHSSTSISAALGMALAARAKGEDRKAIAVIGDGAMTAGMAFEALNHAGDLKADMLVVLNDNDMSISPNVGALNQYLTKILSGKLYSSARESGKKVLSSMPQMAELARRTEEHMKGMVIPGTLFEELGFTYFGPVDGHDLDTLVRVLKNLKTMKGPLFLHVVTQKGKGYRFAEEDALALHAVTPFDPETGKKLSSSAPSGPTYTQVFGQWLCDMAELHPSLCGITPAMREGSGMVEFCKRFPDQYFDVGIAEQHAVTLAAGMACEGRKPVVAIYSTFLQRAYDQLVHDVVLQGLPVLFAIDRAGLVGPDGPTHAGSFDVTFMRCLPGIVLMAPADENECRQMLYTGFLHDGPAAVRYPRGTGPGVSVDPTLTALPIGKAQLRRKGSKIAILAFGSMVSVAEAVAEQLGATVVNMRFIKPLDSDLILSLAGTHELLVSVEENAAAGGAGAGIAELLSEHRVNTPLQILGIPDRFEDQGSREELLAECGLSVSGIHDAIVKYATSAGLAIGPSIGEAPVATVK